MRTKRIDKAESICMIYPFRVVVGSGRSYEIIPQKQNDCFLNKN